MRRLTIALIALLAGSPCVAAVAVDGYKVVHVYPHDTSAYTEGLFYKNGFLYESTGELGASSIRKVQLQTGKVLQQRQLASRYFGEGIVDWKDRLIQLTWKSETGFVYALDDFTPQRTFSYPGEGWALTRDAKQLYMSDGSSVLRILDPDSLVATGSILVTADGVPVINLNELEWVNGEIYANVWLTNRIARIDPDSGHVKGWIDLTGLFDASTLPNPDNDVLNGIAWDAERNRLFVTGKHWPKLFEIKLLPHRRTATDSSAGDGLK